MNYTTTITNWAKSKTGQIAAIRQALTTVDGMEKLAAAMTKCIDDDANPMESSMVPSWNAALSREQKRLAKEFNVEPTNIWKLKFDKDSEVVEALFEPKKAKGKQAAGTDAADEEGTDTKPDSQNKEFMTLAGKLLATGADESIQRVMRLIKLELGE